MVAAVGAFSQRVTFEVDGETYSLEAWSDTSALYAVRMLARHPAPYRGCEAGVCGTCESVVNGQCVRLCTMAATSLDGAQIVTMLRKLPGINVR